MHTIGGGALLFALGAFAQQGKLPRIGFFYFGSRESAVDTGRYPAFLGGMQELGYVEGRTMVLESRFADSKMESLPTLAAEFSRLKVDVIVATASPVYSALRAARNTIPVVVTVTADPVAEGLAATVSQPGGNFTGLSDTAADLAPKQIELLKAVTPRLSRVGVLVNPHNVSHPGQVQRLATASQKLGVQLVQAEAGSRASIETAIASLAQQGGGAVILLGDTFFVQQFHEIARAALKYKMPSVYITRQYPAEGGLMSFGPDISENFRRAAAYVDKIVKGAKPGEMPFEHPTRYSLTINLKAAKPLGLNIDQSVLVRADEIIR
jgi:putative ABC transport system substrate-binding protein